MKIFIKALCSLVFLVSLSRQVLRVHLFSVLALFFGALFVNIGEMVFFSIGGLGLYMWLLMAFSAAHAQASAQEFHGSRILA